MTSMTPAVQEAAMVRSECWFDQMLITAVFRYPSAIVTVWQETLLLPWRSALASV